MLSFNGLVYGDLRNYLRFYHLLQTKQGVLLIQYLSFSSKMWKPLIMFKAPILLGFLNNLGDLLKYILITVTKYMVNFQVTFEV